MRVDKIPMFDGDKMHYVEPIVTPYPNPFKHPIRRWKMRKLRKDAKWLDEQISPEVRLHIQELTERKFLYGDEHGIGDRSGG